MRKLDSKKEFSFSNPTDFSKWIKIFAKNLGNKELILLNGDLGSGKTFFMTNLLQELGQDAAVSPSFAIHNRYETKNLSVDHLDLYRLKNLEDLESTGFWDLFMQESGIIAVEWANKIDVDDFMDSWPIWEIEIQITSGQARKIIVKRFLGSKHR
ncbi:MAG: hypothetical protein A4S09_10335 [Proteobacteria bacterium SG_bin7]|nr:MAG: hypothetical protein A4S09_10335 [Proteobacteria bacterium SG_bin7]